MKKMIKLLFGVMLCVSAFLSTTAFAQESGKCGDNLTWTLDNGILTIKGIGKMYDYTDKIEIPWHDGENSKSIKTVKIENGVKNICDFAFYETSIEELILPDSVEEIGKAFAANCPNLHKVVLPNNIIVIPWAAFNCDIALEEINIPQKVMRIEADAFLLCKSLKKIELPDSLKYIGSQTFDSTDLEMIVFPDKITTLEENICDGNVNLKKVFFPNSLKRIGEFAFSDCPNIECIILPDGLEVIEKNAFSFNGKRRDKFNIQQIIYVPESVNEIGMDAFDENSILYGFAGTYAEIYAKEKNIKFISVKESLYENGYEEYLQEEYKFEELKELTVKTGGDTIDVYADNEAVEFTDVMPFVDSTNRTQMPVRAVAEPLECKVDYIDGLVIIKSGNDIINLTIGSDILTKNGEKVQMDTAAVIISDRTFIPVRYIAEALGYTVNWEHMQ